MKKRDKEIAESLVKGFEIKDWLEAEKEYKNSLIEPQPKGSISVDQYAQQTNRSQCRARDILGKMCKIGLATSQRWRDGEHGSKNVYFLKQKK